ncbi:MAG: transcription-repair coupling factor [Deltaproteobacteria bacterium]|nr:transcription-repair coupling factor [Deltaproteobacteria bacterium]
MEETFSQIDTAFHKALESLSSLCPREGCVLSGLFGSSKAFLISEFFKKTLKPSIAIVPTQDEAEEFYNDLSFFLGKDMVSIYPSWETLPFEMQSPHPDISASRVDVLYKLLKKDIAVLVAAPQAVMQRVMPKNVLEQYIRNLKHGAEVDRDDFISNLISMGYSRTAIIEQMGEISIRGGILDIFAPLYLKPVRIEFFGNEIESIRFFDPDTQRSVQADELKEFTIIPCKEIILSNETKALAVKMLKQRCNELEIARDIRETLSERISGNILFSGMESLMPLFYERLETIFSYIGKDVPVFIIDNQNVIHEADRFSKEILEMGKKMEAKKQFFVQPSELYLSKDEFVSELLNHAAAYISDFKSDPELDSGQNPKLVPASFKQGSEINFAIQSNMDIRQDISTSKEDEKLMSLYSRIQNWQADGWGIFLTSRTLGNAERLKELFEGYGLHLSITNPPFAFSPAKEGASVRIITGSITAGFRFPELKLAVITEDEIFGERVKRRPASSRKIDAFLTQMSDLEMGEPVVHTHHGIGIYQGLKRINIEGIENDFLLIEYQGGDKLYLPVTRLNLVGKYIGVEGSMPALDKLGGTSWEKIKSKAKKAIEEMARELLELYAARKISKGFAFSKPDRIFLEFEEGFEFDETPDQMSAIEDAVKDMEDEKPMDRLICGDVGYGKTEVAMRAAFKAVMDNKQAAVLVPTTILAQQHYLTFKKRFSQYPVIVEVVSRFKSAKEQKHIFKRLSNGEVDIIIGTHRLLQKDVSFKDLGLIIIDEEQWFGVSHKERLKHLRKEVDCLTLTATPIPRTLHMSLSGIRDLSIINTPPEDRLAIKTFVAPFDDSIIRDAVIREMTRGGQIFFVHNRVESIGAMLDYIKRIAPEARTNIAHGQMDKHELEKAMLGFMNKDFDILLSTAIIESGLDIPSANTIIINRADRFGLAQLYQLRGRVGRSKHRAYAYLLIPPETALTKDAKKRLQVIQELSELGSGFRIAAHDMEIRGAGELLGSKQSGRIAEVGFEMYSQMLEHAIKELKGEEKEASPDPEINLKVEAYIPDDYVPDMRQRLNIYKRLASAKFKDEIEDLKIEVIDRFGSLPHTILNLLKVMELKLMLKNLRAVDMSQRGDRLYLTFAKDADISPEKALNLVKTNPKKLKITPDSKIIMFVDMKKSLLEEARWLLQELM